MAGRQRFDVEGMVEACRGAVASSEPERAVRESIAEAVSDGASVAAALGGGHEPAARAAS
jgi:hypothetical protein